MFRIKKSWLILIFSLVFPFLISSSCSKDKIGSQETLEKFINYRFTADQDFIKIVSMTTGSLKEDLMRLNEEIKKQFLDMSSFAKKEFKVISSQCNDNTCYITYYLKYVKISKDTKIPQDEISIKKMATLVSE
jgi:hypothetical protein